LANQVMADTWSALHDAVSTNLAVP
jgi:hypothetical protein